jgi:TatD DNase family protein
MLIDTHSHIYCEEYNGDTDDVLNRALDNGVQKIILPNVDSSTVRRMLELSDRYPDICYPMIGIHPTSVKEDFEEELQVFEYWLRKRKFYGIGEIGIDLYWDKKFIDEQIHVFRIQLQAAKRLRLPVAIHVRDSFPEVLKVVKEEHCADLFGVFHAFSGTVDQAREVIEMGFKIGVGGVVTFKNSGLDEVISQLSIDDIVLETDAPWLTPAPFRGMRNESAYLTLVRNKVAEIFNCTHQAVDEITTHNASQIFPIS